MHLILVYIYISNQFQWSEETLHYCLNTERKEDKEVDLETEWNSERKSEISQVRSQVVIIKPFRDKCWKNWVFVIIHDNDDWKTGELKHKGQLQQWPLVSLTFLEVRKDWRVWYIYTTGGPCSDSRGNSRSGMDNSSPVFIFTESKHVLIWLQVSTN